LKWILNGQEKPKSGSGVSRLLELFEYNYKLGFKDEIPTSLLNRDITVMTAERVDINIDRL